MPLASRWKRLVAVLIDAVIMAVPMAASAQRGLFPDPVLLLLALAGLALGVAQVVWLTKRGQTLGKMALGIRIVRQDTLENGGFVVNVLLRGLVNGLLSLIPIYFLVDSCFIFRKDHRCLHDMIAGTIVVDAREPELAPAAAPA